MYYILIMKAKSVLVWDKWNKKHIEKHNISTEEVEEAYTNRFGHSRTYLNRQAMYGKTKNGKLVTIIVSYAKPSELYVVSARVMSKKERRIFYDEKNL